MIRMYDFYRNGTMSIEEFVHFNKFLLKVRQAFLDLEGGHGFLVPNEVYEALIKVRFSLDLLLFIQSVRAYIRIRMEGSGWMVL
uniref:EF-hand domain-containing protein n=1 Tax=Nelumbo nucifera TaxID=4432 RepID=A0A822ZE52_NELNU|nr:TPA_asm: hypothetical protein HUJ06_016028 [Nelumbo nucifera]